MTDTNRRSVLKVAAAGALAVGVTNQAEGHNLSGPLANATVSFGAWKTDPPLDRYAGSPPPANSHHLLPHEVTIKAGGAVNYIISGLHLVLVYDDGTRPSDINVSTATGAPPLINDSNRRIYRGLNPVALLPVLDRVEVVEFPDPGTYLVICGVLPHFNEGMFGYVKVLP
jgi:plastocyanin